MSVDASKIQYYTGFNTYKNLQVHSGTISIDTTSVAAGTTHTWNSTITVSNHSRFSTAMIQNNRDNNPTVTALKYAPFPSANRVWQTLSIDPGGLNTQSLELQITVNNNQVTFSATTFNDAVGALAFNAFSVAFVYAVHTTDV